MHDGPGVLVDSFPRPDTDKLRHATHCPSLPLTNTRGWDELELRSGLRHAPHTTTKIVTRTEHRSPQGKPESPGVVDSKALLIARPKYVSKSGTRRLSRRESSRSGNEVEESGRAPYSTEKKDHFIHLCTTGVHQPSVPPGRPTRCRIKRLGIELIRLMPFDG